MKRFTTPTITLTVEGIDLTKYKLYVTFKQGYIKFTKTDVTASADNGNTVITVNLTQEETGKLKKGSCKVQINWMDDNGRRNAVDIGVIEVDENLLDEVIEV